mmetsp:Transcript_64182/g.115440  ORF Transcript_64182/g.115440 Transcript_64182/m.115440 type:complete len:635 (-) Transcript_64182:144-2048(-)
MHSMQVPPPQLAEQDEEGGRATRTWQFSKTKMCKFDLIGMCMKGDECPFAHGKVELKTLPDLTCTKLCKTLIQTGSCDEADCNYAHSKEELRATSTFHKTKLCRFSQIGHCALGNKCNFAHSRNEIRPLDDGPALPDGSSIGAQATQQNSWHQQQLQSVSFAAVQLRQNELTVQQELQHLQQQLVQQQLQKQNLQHQQHLQLQQQQLAQTQQQLLQQQEHHQMMALALQHRIDILKNSDSVPQTRAQYEVPTSVSATVLPGNLSRAEVQTPSSERPSRGYNAEPEELTSRRRGGRRGKAQAAKASSAAEAGSGKSSPVQGPATPGAVLRSSEPLAPKSPSLGPCVAAPSNLGRTGFSRVSSGQDLAGGVPGLSAVSESWRHQTLQVPSPVLTGPMPATKASASSSFGSSLSASSQLRRSMDRFSAISSAGTMDSPAYITRMESDFASKYTSLELELGPIRAALRPIQSAAGRLDLLGGGNDSDDELRDLYSNGQGPYGHSSSAGLVSFGGPALFGGGLRSGSFFGDADMAAGKSRTTLGGLGTPEAKGGCIDCAGSSGATSAGSSQVGLPSVGSSNNVSGLTEGTWDSSFYKDDSVWQVKNTFLNYTPQAKPIRSVRTAEGALYSLGSLLDDEP